MLEFAAGAHAVKADIDNGVAPAPAGEAVDIASMSKDKAVAFLRDIRPSLYAVSAVFTDMILDHTEDDRCEIPPHGTDEVTTINQLGLAVYHTTQGGQAEFFAASREQPYFEAWYQRAARLVGYFRESPVQFYGNYGSPEEFINGGLGTGIDNTVRTLDLVDRAHEKYAPGASDDEMLATARRAKSIPVKIARTTPFERLEEAQASLGGVGWHSMVERATAYDMERFTITPSSKNPNVLNIKFSEEALRNPKEPSMELDSLEAKLGRLGCPGMVDFSSAEDPFAHSIDRLYRDLLRSASALKLWRSGNRLPPSRLISC